MKKFMLLFMLLFAPFMVTPMAAQVAHKATLTWTPSTSPCVVTTNIHRVQISGTEVIGTNFVVLAANVTTYVDNTVLAGQTYFFTISEYGTGCDPTGATLDESIMTPEVIAVIPADPVRPAPATNLKVVVQ